MIIILLENESINKSMLGILLANKFCKMGTIYEYTCLISSNSAYFINYGVQ